MRVILTGEEIRGIADRLIERLESMVKAALRGIAVTSTSSPTKLDGGVVQQMRRELARDLAPIVCPEDTLLSSDQARALMGIKKSKWHELRREGRIPDPVPTICGDRWRRSAILACMAHELEGADR